MNLEIRSFTEAGSLAKERIILKALTDLDVGEYAVFKSAIGSGGELPSSGRKIAYWFPDTAVKAEDVIVLYTKKGVSSTKTLSGGRTAYFFYWGRDEVLWGDKQFGAVLLAVMDWQFKIPG